MKIELRKISITKYTDLINNIYSNLNFYRDFSIDTLKLDGDIYTLKDISEPISNSEILEIDINENDLRFASDILKWKENFLLGKLLHIKLKPFEENYFGTLNEPAFWSYLAHHPIFKKYIINRYFLNRDEDDEENEIDSKKIQRYFLFRGTPSRTGIMFNWLITNCLYDQKKHYELSEVAFSFIDSVKGIYERSFRKNKLIVKAFVEGIINNNKSNGFKDSKYRSIIPTHISNIAALNMLDSYDDYKELVNKITFEQKSILAIYNSDR